MIIATKCTLVSLDYTLFCINNRSEMSLWENVKYNKIEALTSFWKWTETQSLRIILLLEKMWRLLWDFGSDFNNLIALENIWRNKRTVIICYTFWPWRNSCFLITFIFEWNEKSTKVNKIPFLNDYQLKTYFMRKNILMFRLKMDKHTFSYFIWWRVMNFFW